MSWIVGIDPGGDGGLTLLPSSLSDHGIFIFPYNGEDGAYDCFKKVVEATGDTDNLFVYVEKVASSTNMGVKSAFTFGHNVGQWDACIKIISPDTETKRPTPQVWQKTIPGMDEVRGFANQKARKDLLWNFAQQLYPNTRIHKRIADSVLIAHWGKLEYNNKKNQW